MEKLKRRGLILVWIGQIWNSLEVIFGFWAGISSGSIALIAFGLDSTLELLAGGVMIWRLGKKWKSENQEKLSERKSQKLIGITFFILALFILVQSLAVLFGFLPHPDKSIAGIIVILASVVVMSVLYFAKTKIAKQLGSRALRAEAIETLICDIQDLTVVIGIGLNAFLGWWWADPIAALFLIPFLIKEGWEGVFDND